MKDLIEFQGGCATSGYFYEMDNGEWRGVTAYGSFTYANDDTCAACTCNSLCHTIKDWYGVNGWEAAVRTEKNAKRGKAAEFT